MSLPLHPGQADAAQNPQTLVTRPGNHKRQQMVALAGPPDWRSPPVSFKSPLGVSGIFYRGFRGFSAPARPCIDCGPPVHPVALQSSTWSGIGLDQQPFNHDPIDDSMLPDGRLGA